MVVVAAKVQSFAVLCLSCEIFYSFDNFIYLYSFCFPFEKTLLWLRNSLDPLNQFDVDVQKHRVENIEILWKTHHKRVLDDAQVVIDRV